MKTLLFLGQAPARPASKHEIPGTYLHAWLHSIGLTDQAIQTHCHFYALTDTFPGAGKSGHLPPTKAQIAQHLPVLKSALKTIQPDVIIPVGKMAIAEITKEKNAVLEKYIGTKFSVNPFGALPHEIVCIPLPHPSGRSIWTQTHQELVAQALNLLQEEVSQ